MRKKKEIKKYYTEEEFEKLNDFREEKNRLYNITNSYDHEVSLGELLEIVRILPFKTVKSAIIKLQEDRLDELDNEIDKLGIEV